MSEPVLNTSPMFNGKNILSKLNELMQAIPYIQKDSENKEQKYKYLSYEGVMEKLQSSLIRLKLVALPAFETAEEREYSTAKGAMWKYVKTRLTLQIVDAETGEYCTVLGEGSGVDPGDKAVAKAQTMAMKNLWCKLLAVPIGDDPEADPATDQQQFISNPQALANISYGFPQYEQDIVSCWNYMGWGAHGPLQAYIQNRFQRPPAQLTVEECYALKNEFTVFVQQKQGGQYA